MFKLNSQTWIPHDNSPLRLKAYALDIWAFSQAQPLPVSEALRSILSADELSGAEKFYTSTLQNQYIVRHGVLRNILSYYLSCSADEIIFSYGEWGKPSIEHHSIHFNLSHSREAVLVAVSNQPMTGLDIEYIVPIPDMKSVARRHFSPYEQAVLFALDETQQVQAFYRCWTRKEAFIKADGRGLDIALDSFDVTLAPHNPPQVLRVGDSQDVADQFTMQNLPLDEHYLGAVMVFGAIQHQRYWQVDVERLSLSS